MSTISTANSAGCVSSFVTVPGSASADITHSSLCYPATNIVAIPASVAHSTKSQSHEVPSSVAVIVVAPLSAALSLHQGTVSVLQSLLVLVALNNRSPALYCGPGEFVSPKFALWRGVPGLQAALVMVLTLVLCESTPPPVKLRSQTTVPFPHPPTRPSARLRPARAV